MDQVHLVWTLPLAKESHGPIRVPVNTAFCYLSFSSFQVRSQYEVPFAIRHIRLLIDNQVCSNFTGR